MLFYAVFSYTNVDTTNEENTDTWLQEIESKRRKWDKDQKKSNQNMIKRFCKKNPVNKYNIGECVYVFNTDSKTRRGKKILGKIPTFEGRVIEKKDKEYKVQYETNDKQQLVDWFPVSHITSKTKHEESQRKNKSRNVDSRIGSTKKNMFPVDKIISTFQEKGATQSSKSITENNKEKENTTFTSLYSETRNISQPNTTLEQHYEILKKKLEKYNLAMHETISDCNCFFRAISRMVYASDDFHLVLRNRAVEHVRMYPDLYQPYILGEYSSVQQYVESMEKDGCWADNAIIRATAETLAIQIYVITSRDDVPTYEFTPTNNVYTQTVFLGHVYQQHYVSTTALSEPQVMGYGGCTRDGVRLIKTKIIDNILTWLFFSMTRYDQILSFMEELSHVKNIRQILEYLMQQTLKNTCTNSLQVKKLTFMTNLFHLNQLQTLNI